MPGYHYSFVFSPGDKKRFTIELDENWQLKRSNRESPAPWTALGYHQCVGCPLALAETDYCPVAVNIEHLVFAFKDILSHTPCLVCCMAQERTVTKQTTAQDGLSSILGLIMATSGCPIMDFFRPLARFHLPFASVDESIFRAMSVYLLHQYFANLKSRSSEVDLQEMKRQYLKVRRVNQGILSRIKGLSAEDADKNALVTLNSLAQVLDLEIDMELESLRHLFQSAASNRR